MNPFKAILLLWAFFLVLSGINLYSTIALGQSTYSIDGLDQYQGKDPRKTKDIEDKNARDTACSCCRDCKAATRSIRGKEEGPPLTDGCKDCCDRCGAVDMPIPGQLPSDIIQKK